VSTVEPIVAAGSGRAVVARDGWTVRTADRRTSAQILIGRITSRRSITQVNWTK
jgi:hypothetical protein